MVKEKLTREQLIEKAKAIQDTEERVLFVMKYFLNTVSYDYAFLLGVGYAMGSISEISNKKLGYEDLFHRTQDNLPLILFKYETDTMIGHSEILSRFSELEKEVSSNGGSYEDYEKKIEEYLKEELSKHIDNEELIDANIERLMSFLMDASHIPLNVIKNNQKHAGRYSLQYILMELIIQKENIFKTAVINDGLITSGVCADYSKYIVPLLKEIGIDAYTVSGTSELSHEWIIAKIGDRLKSIDLTRAVFIRDGFKGIPKEQTVDDWLLCDLKESLDMQATRTITEIEDKKLGTAMNAGNYDEDYLNRLIMEIDKKPKSAITIEEIMKNNPKSISKKE